MELCPCGSKKQYNICCEPFLSNKAIPDTAEVMMRSRYTAYVKNNINYIESTHSLEKRDDLSVDETRKWAENSTWKGLKIVSTIKGKRSDSSGQVEFIAKYAQDGKDYEHHEISEFKKVEDKWYFDKGQIFNSTIRNEAPKVGRNDPCPCGCGRKYKQCPNK